MVTEPRTRKVLIIDEDGNYIGNDNVKNYLPVETDQSDVNNRYFGFQKYDGNWYILKTTGAALTQSHRYVAGTDDFSTNWTNRASLSYDYPSNVF